MKDMKKVCYFICAVMALVLCACEKEMPQRPVLPEEVRADFNHRYPGVKVKEAYDFTYDQQVLTEVVFYDKNYVECKADYEGGLWLITYKYFDTEEFEYCFPAAVRETWIDLDLEKPTCSDNEYVVEIDRNGMDQKQYEVCSNSCHVVIAEDGTLLARSKNFNRSSWFLDLRASIEIVREKYPDAELLGTVHDGSRQYIIRDNGILKYVKTRSYWPTVWETSYRISIDTVLPGFVLEAIATFEAANPQKKLFALSIVERWDGNFYGLFFGNVQDYTTIFVQFE